MTVYGSFDGSQSGELVLHEPRLVVRLRPGDTIFFPSACITHANLRIHEHEGRNSLVLYSSAGLYRYDAQGHRTKKGWAASPGGAGEVMAFDALGEERWNDGWRLYSTENELFDEM